MRPSAIIENITEIFRDKDPIVPFLIGQPGIGKSSFPQAVANNLGVDLWEFRPNLHEPIDLMGMMHATERKTTGYYPPDFLPTKGEGIIFIDELPQAHQQMQNALSQLILDYKIQGYTVPKGWRNIIVAGNRMSDGAATFRVPSHMANRIMTINVEFNIEDWARWAFENGIDHRIIGFAKWRTDLLTGFDAKVGANKQSNGQQTTIQRRNNTEIAFCTPRSLAKCTYVLNKRDRAELCAGLIGEGAAIELIAYCTTDEKKPTMEEVLSSPDTVEVPTEASIRFATIQMLIFNVGMDNADTVMKYVNRFPKEYQARFIKESINRGNGSNRLALKESYCVWSANNKDMLLI